MDNLIRARMREYGFTVRDVARLAGVSPATVSYAAQGHRPGRPRPVGDHALTAIAGALGVSVAGLRDDAQFDPLRRALRDFAAGQIDADEFAARMNDELAKLGHAARVAVTNERPEGAVCACCGGAEEGRR